MLQRWSTPRNVTKVLILSAFFLLAVGLLSIAESGISPESVAYAQDDDPLSDILGGDLAPPAADAAADAGGGDAAPTATGGDATDDAPSGKPKSYLGWIFGSLGLFFGIVFLALSFTMVALFVMNLLATRRENIIPSGLVEQFETHLDEKEFQEAYELAKNDGSFLGMVLSAGLAKLSNGYPEAVQAMEDVGEEEAMKHEHRLSYLALIGNISPMIGLFGTVYGMMATFSMIANSTGTPKPNELAGGISTALVTTFIGLAIAIPAIASFSIMKNRIARMVLEIGILSDNLMARFKKQ